MEETKLVKFRVSVKQEALRVRIGSEEGSEFKYFEAMISTDGGMEAELKQA